MITEPEIKAIFAAKQSKWRNDRKAVGLCRDCKEPAIPGRVQCAYHLEASRLASIRHREKLRGGNGADHPHD